MCIFSLVGNCPIIEYQNFNIASILFPISYWFVHVTVFQIEVTEPCTMQNMSYCILKQYNFCPC